MSSSLISKNNSPDIQDCCVEDLRNENVNPSYSGIDKQPDLEMNKLCAKSEIEVKQVEVSLGKDFKLDELEESKDAKKSSHETESTCHNSENEELNTLKHVKRHRGSKKESNTLKGEPHNNNESLDLEECQIQEENTVKKELLCESQSLDSKRKMAALKSELVDSAEDINLKTEKSDNFDTVEINLDNSEIKQKLSKKMAPSKKRKNIPKKQKSESKNISSKKVNGTNTGKCSKKFKLSEDETNGEEVSSNDNRLKQNITKKTVLQKKKKNQPKIKESKKPFPKKIMKVTKTGKINSVVKDRFKSTDNHIEQSTPPKLDKKEEMNLSVKDLSINDDSVPSSPSSVSSIFKPNIPLIGKNIITSGDVKPLHARYDLARRMNELRAIQWKKESSSVEYKSYHDWRKEQDARTDEEKKLDKAKKLREDLVMAHSVSQISVNIFTILNEDEIDEKALARQFKKFLNNSATPTATLYNPHFVHAAMMCRANKSFSRALRKIAQRCYFRCHSMFPIFCGTNFETVYSSLVLKAMPESMHRCEDLPLDYEELSESDDDENKENRNHG